MDNNKLHINDTNLVSLKEYIEERMDSGDKMLFASIDANHKQHMMMLEAQEKALNAAIIANDKLNTVAFNASEKAIAKAESAQAAYNARSNEFRASLDDQQKTFLSRNEAETHFQQLRELFDSHEKRLGDIQMTLSRGEGGQMAQAGSKQQANWLIGLIIGIVMSSITFIIMLFKR